MCEWTVNDAIYDHFCYMFFLVLLRTFRKNVTILELSCYKNCVSFSIFFFLLFCCLFNLFHLLYLMVIPRHSYDRCFTFRFSSHVTSIVWRLLHVKKLFHIKWNDGNKCGSPSELKIKIRGKESIC